MRMTRIVLLFIVVALLWMSCGTTSTIGINVLKPAAVDMPGVKKIAVVDFKGPEGSGSQIAAMVQSMLMESQHYEIMERDKISRLLEEQNMGMAGIVDPTTAAKVGAILGVDAMVFGEISTYEVPPDKKITNKVKEQKFTGKYETVEEKDSKTGQVKQVRKKIYEDVWVDKVTWVRQGSVAINFRVVDVKTGKLLAAHSDAESYDSQKEKKSWFSQEQKLKPQGEILSDLSQNICRRFVHMIAPYYETENRIIEGGEGQIAVGKKYADVGLWPEAMEAWQQAVQDLPQNPSGYYDLGLAYEVQGDLARAEAAYKKAVELNTKTLYMEALARIRAAQEDQIKLQEQLKDR